MRRIIRRAASRRVAESLTPADHEQILESSQRNNGKAGVTGILADPRHRELVLIDCRDVEQRWFGEWGMHGLPPSRLTRQPRGRAARAGGKPAPPAAGPPAQRLSGSTVD